MRAIPSVMLAMLLPVLWSAPARAQDDFRRKVTDALPSLDRMAQEQVGSGGVPGIAIAVVLRDEVIYLKGFGVREAGKDAVVDPDTVFQLASLSKPISSTVVAALVSDGKIGWDARIADVDPGFQLHDPYPTAELTIRDLFSHRSGLPGDAGDDLETLGYDRAEILRRVRYLTPASSFRAGYAYSNFGLTEGAVAAAHAAGLPWEDAAQRRLFEPLGMTATSARYRDFLARTDRAALHIPRDGRWQALLTRDPDAQAPAGGVSSTARDLTRWVRLELADGRFEGREVIKPDAIAATHAPVMPRGQDPITHRDGFYGLGWSIDYTPHGTVWGHAGAFSVGAHTLVQLIPSRQIGIVVLTNAFPTGVSEGIAANFFDTVFDGAPSCDWIAAWNTVFSSMFGPAAKAAIAQYGTSPANVSPALPQAAYLGVYANDYLGPVRVAADDGRLVLRMGPGGKASYGLTHFDRDTFTMHGTPEMPDMPSPVSFTVGEGRRATTLTIGGPDPTGRATLRLVPD